MNRISDNINTELLIPSTVLSASSADSGYFDISEFDTYLAMVKLETIGAVSVDVKVEVAEDAVGTNAEDLIASTNLGAPPTPDPFHAALEIKGDSLPDGKTFIKITVTETAGELEEVTATVWDIRENPHKRYENKVAADTRLQSWADGV